ncbi:MAG: hypothetical protein KC464_08485, partial [Myxococcales bacterium]|nr:hypothetical protein [Myxococcales bacterium]
MRALVVAAVVALALGAGAGVARAQLASPGPLSAAHQDLDGDSQCSNCHQAGKQVVAKLCLDCHKDLEKRIDAGKGLHGVAYKGKACEGCHVEHYGRKAKLVRWPGGDMSKLDHDDTGWKLEGAHGTVKCLDCHTRKSSAGKPTFLGASTSCNSCHKDPHTNRFGSTCTKCHTERDWKEVDLDKFDHGLARFKLEGLHAEVACQKCHGRPAKWTGLRFGACVDCHADPHKGRFKQKCEDCHTVAGWKNVSDVLAKNHPGVSLSNGHRRVKCEKCHDQGNDKPPKKGGDCVDCHKVVHDAPFGKKCESCHRSIKWLGLPRKIGLDAHGKTPYPLAGKHVDVQCGDCHKGKTNDQKYRKLEFGACAACHADKHDGRLARRGDCATCHTVDGFAPTSFGVDQHATAQMALDGRHVAVRCGACHGDKRPRLDFRVDKRACADCHANPHGDQFATEMAAGGCASCHVTTAWKQAKVDHSTWPLVGAHSRTACAACHGEVGTPGKAATAAFRGIPRDCEGCHEDVHAGQFRTAEPKRACGDCHGNERFKPLDFDHAGKAGFVLDGGHARAKCEGCHAKTTLRNGAESTRYRLGYRACEDCHANPHKERGGDSMIGDMRCSECHATEAWKMTSGGSAASGGFDHDKTGFPLRNAHRDTSCQSCHAGAAHPPTACAGCHDDAHDGRLGSACAECHRSTDWVDTRTMARHRQTRMPLTGRHAEIDCTACHRRTSDRAWSDVPSDCFACHADDYRQDIHPDHDGDLATGLEPFPRDCGGCHRTTGWLPATSLGGALPRLVRTSARIEHDVRFPISSGAHRTAQCEDCHLDERRPERLRCAGCHGHDDVSLTQQHGRRVAGRSAAACLRCHPGG